MADSGDTYIQNLDLLAPALMALIAGLLVHSFIIGVNVSDWWKGRSVTAVDQIVTSLGMSRMCTQCAATLHVFRVWFFLSILDSRVTSLTICTLYALFIYANFWLTFLLSIVFYVKISNFNTRLFQYLRGMIVHRTGHLIVASGLISALNAFTPLSTFVTKVPNGGIYNSTLTNLFTDDMFVNVMYNIIIGAVIPLLFYGIFSGFLFTSLCLHATKMKSMSLSISLETYYSAMRFISFTFIYNTVYSLCHFFNMFYYNFYPVGFVWIHIVLEFLSVLHSSYLIYRTSKIRSQMSKVFQNVVHFLFQKKSEETRENIETIAQ